jgi:phosphoenolpyruvate-protein phosphotransferase (PTS system enzyme I)
VGELLHGLAVSPGYATGPIYRVAARPSLPAPAAVSTEQLQSEVDKARAALVSVAADLRRRASVVNKPAIADILAAQALMADDPTLHATVAEKIMAGRTAPYAIDEALAAYREAFLAGGDYLAERVADLDDLRDRAVAATLGQPMPGIPEPGHPFVLAARDLAPADTAGLDPAVVLALVTEEGGPTSHTAIVARSLGIPAVVRCVGVLSIDDTATVAVDGTTGELRVNPDAALVSDLRTKEEQRRIRLAQSSGPGRTADGHPVALLANIGSAADLTGVGGAGAEGVGLFRTELLYLDRATAPSQDEQVAAYRAVFEAAAGRPVVVRTLDAGADKPLAFLHQADEPNPALGIRGLRLGLQQPDVLQTQLEAIATAARATGARVRVMAPMVATPAEARQFATWCSAAGLSTVGVMVEVPSAALRAPALLAEVDFLSIGTNDLSQYTFAADRMCGALAELLDPWQPALLALIAACGEAGRNVGKPVGICGEAASDPTLAPVLVGLGISSLSMSPRSIPAVRESLAGVTLDDCRRLAQAALAATDAVDARAAANPSGQT